jgi:hypothetical protein
VKNYFYSSVRKNIRKISMKRVSYENKENEVEREMTIYLCQYILQMYKDYLTKKRKQREDKIEISGLDSQNDDQQMDPREETKEMSKSSLKSGDKYVIRKLVSLKILPDDIQEYIDMLISGTPNPSQSNQYLRLNYQNYAPNVNHPMLSDFNQNYLQVSAPSHARSSSCMNEDRNEPVNGMQNMGVMDDSNLIQSFGQFNLSNQNYNFKPMMNAYEQYQLSNQQASNSNDLSMDNNFSSNNDPISSLPLHMRAQNKPIRSQSSNRIPESSKYMKETFLFEKMQPFNLNDDNTLRKDVSPIQVEKREFVPKVLKYNINNAERRSSPSRSSQSSMISSFNDAISCSSLDMSFDGSGNPYLKSIKASAFAKFQTKNKSERSSSISEDDKRLYSNQEVEKGLVMDDD